MEGVQGRREKNHGSKWTEDRKKRHSEKMKAVLEKKKRTNAQIEQPKIPRKSIFGNTHLQQQHIFKY